MLLYIDLYSSMIIFINLWELILVYICRYWSWMTLVSLHMLSRITFAQIEPGNSRSTYQQSGDPSTWFRWALQTKSISFKLCLTTFAQTEHESSMSTYISTVSSQMLDFDKPLKTSSSFCGLSYRICWDRPWELEVHRSAKSWYWNTWFR